MNASAQTPGTLNTMFAAALPSAGTAVNLYFKHPTTGWYHVKYGVHWGWVSASYIQNIGASPYVNKYTGPNRSPKVVLTFEDCPSTLTSFDDATIYARDNGIGLVFAPTGTCLSGFKSKYGIDLASRARARGHYLINHSVTHAELTRLSTSGILRELSSPGVTTNTGRPPFGAVNTTVNSAYALKGMYQWFWDVDTRDWKNKSKTTTIYNPVLRAKPGSTVLIHRQWYGFSPDSLRQIKAGLAERGLGVCRPFRGYDNAGAVLTSPFYIPQSLPC